ncbi:hypothetical protein [Neptunomonas sp.]|uniref:hypothetical protein n=1 Tax=Neptunomonas sp. TaxID=1971898 RepID=UPI00356A8213
MSPGKKFKTSINSAVEDAFGKKVLWVIFLLILVSWFSDLLLDLIKHFLTPSLQGIILTYDINILVDSFIDTLIITIVLIVFWIFYKKGVSSYTYADRYDLLDGTEKVKKNILLCILSPYKAYNIKTDITREQGDEIPTETTGFDTLDKFASNLKNIPRDKTARDLRGTLYQSNWIPSLRVIEQYPEINEIIVITTSGNTGSYEQYEVFRDFLKTKFYKRNINVFNYKDYIVNNDIASNCAKGLPSNNFKQFTEAVLHIIHNIDTKDGQNCKNVVIDVTGGVSYMTAVLSAASVKNGIELHYTDTHEFTSHVLDINVN